MQNIKSFLLQDDGAAAIEYGLLAALIAGVIIASVIIFGKTLCGIFTSINTAISTGSPYAYAACA